MKQENEILKQKLDDTNPSNPKLEINHSDFIFSLKIIPTIK